eukprot:7139762-Pyramimonas_sp.AAC.1
MATNTTARATRCEGIPVGASHVGGRSVKRSLPPAAGLPPFSRAVTLKASCSARFRGVDARASPRTCSETPTQVQE